MECYFDEQECNVLEDIGAENGTYFVTGATGFIGRYIVLSLLYICRQQAMMHSAFFMRICLERRRYYFLRGKRKQKGFYGYKGNGGIACEVYK